MAPSCLNPLKIVQCIAIVREGGTKLGCMMMPGHELKSLKRHIKLIFFLERNKNLNNKSKLCFFVISYGHHYILITL